MIKIRKEYALKTRVDLSMRAKVVELAVREQIEISDVVRAALREYLQRHSS